MLCYSLALNRPMEVFFFFSKIHFFIHVIFNSANLSRWCVKQAVLGLIPSGDQIFFYSVLYKIACERKRIHLMSKKKEKVNTNRVAHLSKYFYSMSKLSWHDHKCGKGRMHLVKTRSNLVM